jgi:hypothetical protein
MVGADIRGNRPDAQQVPLIRGDPSQESDGKDGGLTLRSDNVKGHRPGNDPPPSKVERVGRICTEGGCDTRLSIYNKSGFCWQHQPLIFPNYRGKRLVSS